MGLRQPGADSIDLELLEMIYEVPLASARAQTPPAPAPTRTSAPKSARQPTPGLDWAPVLNRLRRRLRANGSVLMTEASGRLTKLDLQGHGEPAWRAYANHYHALDPFLKARASGRLPLGQVASVDHLEPTLTAGEYYQDFWRPNRIRHEAGAFCADARGGLGLHLALPRGADAGPYTDDELAVLGVYVGHIFRALRLQQAMAPGIGAAVAAGGPDLDAFGCQYGLTPAETRLLGALRDCGTLKAASARLGRSHNTGRAQLRAIFAKTETHGQVALMTLLHRGS